METMFKMYVRRRQGVGVQNAASGVGKISVAQRHPCVASQGCASGTGSGLSTMRVDQKWSQMPARVCASESAWARPCPVIL